MKKLFTAAILAGGLTLGSAFAPNKAEANWFQGGIAWYTSCMITHAHIFIQYNYTGSEASNYCRGN